MALSSKAPGEHIAGPVTTPGVNVVLNPRLAYSYGEAARAVGCSARTIWSACASGELRAARVGRRRLIAVAELHRWLNEKSGIAAAPSPAVQAKGGAR